MTCRTMTCRTICTMTRRLFLFAFLPPFSSLAFAQAAPGATVTFAFSNPALQPPRYSLLVHGDGTAHYHAEEGSTPPPEFERDLRLDDRLRGRLDAAARKNKWFTAPCESKHSAKVAFTGNKTFTYAGPEGQGSCTFNYAQDAQLEQLSNDLIAVAATLEEGRKLETLLAHDKLGLETEVEMLGTQAAGGRALDLQNIAPVLRAIADSDGVMTHTRTRAAALLPH